MVIFWGLALLTATLIGGVLVVAAGCIILPKIRVIAIASGWGGSLNNQRNLKIIAALFLIVGLILSSTAITNKNLNEWNKNKQDVLSKLEANIQTNNLEEAKKMIDQYELIVKNDPEFDAVVGNPPYQETVEKTQSQSQANSKWVYYLFQNIFFIWEHGDGTVGMAPWERHHGNGSTFFYYLFQKYFTSYD